MRYARPEFLDAVAGELPLPMIVDAECGMPLDLGHWESLWEEGADDSSELSLIVPISYHLMTRACFSRNQPGPP